MVGYVPTGVRRLDRAGELALNQVVVLTSDTFVRGESIEAVGVQPTRELIEL